MDGTLGLLSPALTFYFWLHLPVLRVPLQLATADLYLCCYLCKATFAKLAALANRCRQQPFHVGSVLYYPAAYFPCVRWRMFPPVLRQPSCFLTAVSVRPCKIPANRLNWVPTVHELHDSFGEPEISEASFSFPKAVSALFS